MLSQRRSGILLHPTSLPGPQSVGSLGAEARHFVDFLSTAGQTVWQLLPLGPTGYGNCPYSCFSAFAGNPLLISLQQLCDTGDLKKSDLAAPAAGSNLADFSTAIAKQLPILDLACRNFQKNADPKRHQAFANFCMEQASWLDDYALFEAIRAEQDYHGWQQWPQELRQRDPAALDQLRQRLEQDIFRHKYLQFVFFEQWLDLKRYANSKGILIFGDLPIFVAENSADIWANQQMFHLDEQGQPQLVSGVPPDYFSETGQRWGNPLYRWETMATDQYSWWKARFDWNLTLFDLIRVDHFRGFSACWAIPANEPTARNGYWMEVPGEHFFSHLRQQRPILPIIAEDLGVITPDVEKLRDRFGFPGMKILQFAFDSGPDNPYLPHNHLPNSVVYTGTHDNNTTLGWWSESDAAAKQRVKDYLLRPCREMPWPLVETALASVAKLAILPLQDILSLPAGSRMNTPGTATGNWEWRFTKQQLTDESAERLRNLSHLYGRNLCISTEM